LIINKEKRIYFGLSNFVSVYLYMTYRSMIVKIGNEEHPVTIEGKSQRALDMRIDSFKRSLFQSGIDAEFVVNSV
jgi:hypothetical protein